MRRPSPQSLLAIAAIAALLGTLAVAGYSAAAATGVVALPTPEPPSGEPAAAPATPLEAGDTTPSGGVARRASTPTHRLADPGPALDGVYRIRPSRPGDVPVTSAELGTELTDPVGTEIDLTEAACLAQHGFYLDARSHTDPPGFDGSDADLAENGWSGLGDDYRWQDAGCYGYAVHMSPNDGMD